MKTKTTTKAIKAYNPIIINAGYCDLQTLLINHSPVQYTCGVYGWNYDVYYIDGVCICTGYRGMPGKRANNIHEYENKAKKVMERNISFDTKKEMIENYLHDFIEQA